MASRKTCLCANSLFRNMRLIGCNSVDQLGPEFIDVRGLNSHSVGVASDFLGLNVYDPLIGPQEKAKL